MSKRILVPSNYEHDLGPKRSHQDKIDLSRINPKFWKNDTERQEAQKRDKPLYDEFIMHMARPLHELYMKGYRLVILKFEPTANRMHALIARCCGNQNHPTDEIRESIGKQIVERTRWQHVFWEQL